MNRVTDFPVLVFVLSLVGLWLSARVGGFIREKQGDAEKETTRDFDFIMAAALTLLSLIIGFSFSLAISRYDQRKNYEEAEANAIGTEYVRAGLLPAADAATVRGQLRKYLELRILYYQTRNDRELQQINADTAQLQNKMWSAVQVPA